MRTLTLSLLLCSFGILCNQAESTPSNIRVKRPAIIRSATEKPEYKRDAPLSSIAHTEQDSRSGLWSLYSTVLSTSRYVDLSHTIKPKMPLWRGFGDIVFERARNRDTNVTFTYEDSLFEATRVNLPSDQIGSQLDAPAHFNPYYAGSDEIPPTFALRKLVVIDVSHKVAKNASYSASVRDVLEWEMRFGKIPMRSVVFFRSDWSRSWPDVDTSVFPQVHVDTVKFLHLKRGILFHGHEPLDTDMTEKFDAERWLLSSGYAQAEGVTNLHMVPPVGCLLSTGFAKFAGALGNYVRYIAICPNNWGHGVIPGEIEEAPMRRHEDPLVWDYELGYRVRKQMH